MQQILRTQQRAAVLRETERAAQRNRRHWPGLRTQGRGYATEALKKVLEYLTENEGIKYVTAWCAAENEGSLRVLEKAGMQLVRIEKGGLTVGDKVYDKMILDTKGAIA